MGELDDLVQEKAGKSFLFIHVCVLVAQTCSTLCGSLNCVARQASLSMELFRQEYSRRVAISFSSGSSLLRD